MADKTHEDFNKMSYSELKEYANELCLNFFGKNIIETFDNDLIGTEELIYEIMQLQKKIRFRDFNAKCANERMELNKPATIQAPLTLDDEDKKKTFIDYWREKWDMRIVHQDIPRDLYCLSFLSQYFRDKTIFRGSGAEEDIRIHVCLIMPSGTGKSDGNDILSQVCEMAGLSTYYLDRYTDAILTGSIDQKKVERNTKLRANPGDPHYQNPVQRSVLEMYNFIVYDEGENILKTGSGTEGAQRYLQKAMNRYGSAANRVTNTLVGNSVECYPNCNVIVTSYYLEQFKETLLKRGLLQRMIVFITEENESQRTDIINRIVDSVPTFKNNVNEARQKKEVLMAMNDVIDAKIMHELKMLKEHHKDTTSIYIQEGVPDVIKEIIAQLRDILPMMSHQREVWNSMISRLTVNILKISTLFALMNYRDYVIEQDVRNAANILLQTMDSVGFFLKKHMKHYVTAQTMSYYNSLKKTTKVGIPMSEKEMVEFVIEKFKVDEIKAHSIIDSLAMTNKINVTFNDGVKKFRIVG